MKNKTRLSIFTGTFMFGLIDNGIMVIVGKTIDNTLAKTLGLSTMASAGVGNAISDVVGTLGEGLVLLLLIKLFGEVVRGSINKKEVAIWSALGIFTGCIVGMTPLLFMN